MDSAGVEVRQTPDRGRGVFATEVIPKGTLVARCEGVVCTTEDLPPDWFAMQIGDNLWLCSEGEALDDCINHCCEPNIGFLTGEPSLYAMREILPGEEICWDYSTSIGEPGWTLECLCDASRCRRTVRSFTELTREDQERLRPISLSYLRNSGSVGVSLPPQASGAR